MSDSVKGIARLLTEDPDIFSDYQDKFSEHTVLDEEIYGEIVGILRDVAEKNGLILDHSRLKVKFNPAGISIQNIHLEAPDPRVKRDLIARVAEVTGDDNIKHTFNKNLRINLYNAINKEFADRVREELNLEVTHQATDPEMAKNSSEVLPMATFAQPAVTAEKPEEEMDMAGPMGAELEGGPEAPTPEGDMGMGGMGGGMGGMGGGMGGMGGGMGGMGGGMGGMGPMGDLEGLEEPPSPEEGPEGAPGAEEPEAGPFGVEPPEEDEVEEAPPLKPGEEDEMLSFESVQKIANMITEDPDIFED